MSDKEGKEKWALGAIIGTAVGFVAGILTAPKSGKETREEVKETAEKEADKAEAELEKANDELEALISAAKKTAETASKKIKVEVDQAVSEAKVAKDKTKKLITAARNGEADDDEVSKVLKDVKKAIKNLKNYYKS